MPDFNPMSLRTDGLPEKPRPPAPQPLGQLAHDGRGYEVIQFTDADGRRCTWQQSEPGALWLGRDGALVRLSNEQAADLAVRLREWLGSGSFNVPPGDLPGAG